MIPGIDFQLFRVLSLDEVQTATRKHLFSKSPVDKRSERPKSPSEASDEAMCGPSNSLHPEILERAGVDCMQAFQPLACQHCLLIGRRDDVYVVAASRRTAKTSKRGVCPCPEEGSAGLSYRLAIIIGLHPSRTKRRCRPFFLGHHFSCDALFSFLPPLWPPRSNPRSKSTSPPL